jgi:hypothetical protein
MTASKRAATLGLLLLVGALAIWRSGAVRGQPARSVLRLEIFDPATQAPFPARVELLDREGKGYVAEDALLVGGDPKDRETPWQGTAQEYLAGLTRAVRNPYTKTVQFYSSGRSTVALAPGGYRLTVTKGLEYRVARQELEIAPGRNLGLRVALERWSDLRDRRWFGADGHLHIARPLRELDPQLSKWMQAEDLAVATLLQWGHLNRFHNTLQHTHGTAGVYREGSYLLASGQESPRTHLLGHTIIWGASTPIEVREQYVIYRLFWEEARRQRAVSGYAHAGLAAGALNGLSIDLPLGMLSFLEVLQFNFANYDVWYTILSTGFRLAPTAGTDYPFGDLGLPGSERFYTRIEGALSYDGWIEGIRRGRTFVTNGPLLEFQVSGREAGDDVVLPAAGPVEIEARVRFDATRDAVERLELIINGEVARTFPRGATEGQIEARFQVELNEAAWLALRASGAKVGLQRPVPSLAHSGAVYVRVAGAPELGQHPRARALARTWATRLTELEQRLGSQIDSMGISGWDDDLPGDYLRSQRAALLEAIRSARKHFLEQAR